MDQTKTIFASDYLLQITTQIGRWLSLAGWDLVTFREAWHAETVWLRQHEGKGAHPYVFRGDQEEKRQARLSAALVGFFHGSGSALDALAATMIGVLGLQADMVTASWSTIVTAMGVPGKERERERLLAATGSAARVVQENVLAAVATAVGAGPHGWLRWTLDMRHVMVHRAHRFELRRFFRRNPRSPLDYVLHLPRDPQLTDAEAFVLGSRGEDLVLWEHAGDTMDGVLTQLLAVVETTVERLEIVWGRRRADPALIVQPDQQWKSVFPTRRDLSQFAGFSAPLPALHGQLTVATSDGKRLRAARIMDRDKPFWWGQLGGKP